ncbi:DUF6221 family protein (plasmid) [Streptomyces sp. NBC_01003]|nr:DUF6221 family protein [Streptomyces sp. NBC_01003]
MAPTKGARTNFRYRYCDSRSLCRMHPATFSRRLREIDAKRRIIGMYATALEDRAALRVRMREVIDSDADEFGRLHLPESRLIDEAQGLSPAARLLAPPYADRPGPATTRSGGRNRTRSSPRPIWTGASP